MPHYITSEARSLFLENYEYSTFDLKEKDRVQICVFASRMRARSRRRTRRRPDRTVHPVLGKDAPAPRVDHGRRRGGVAGRHGQGARILERLEALDAPVAAVWLQDWVGQRKTSFGTQLWWNWELDRDHYPDWDSLGESLKRKNIRLMTYINPFVCDDVG